MIVCKNIQLGFFYAFQSLPQRPDAGVVQRRGLASYSQWPRAAVYLNLCLTCSQALILESLMKSTHNTAIAYTKGITAACVMAAGTALLMAWAGDMGSVPLQHYSQRQLEALTIAAPEQLVALPTHKVSQQLAKNIPIAAHL